MRRVGERAERRRECFGVWRADKEQFRRMHARRFGGCRTDILFQRYVKIAAAKSEGTDRGAPWPRVRCDPGARFGVDVEAGAVADRVGGLFDLDGWRQYLAAQGFDGLQETCRAGGRFRVANLGLDRADRAPGAVAWIGFAEHD